MTLVVTEALVLHAFDYLESSRIVRLATREMGVQSVLARGARRPRNRFGHSLDVWASGVAHFTVRPGRDLCNLAGFDVTRSRMDLAANLDRFAAAAALAELALRFGHADPHDDAFDVLTGAFDALMAAAPGAATDAGLAGVWWYVAALGFAPTVDICCSCHAEVPVDEPASFSHPGGGVTCRRCIAHTPVSRELPPTARAALLSWIRGEPHRLAGDAERRAHLRLLREFVHHHVSEERELPAVDAWTAAPRTT
jgi:DNA repair protein RecO (recombination protein O)